MRKVNSSSASLAISLVALFVALGGTALAVSTIGTKQIKNGAVTSAKVKNGAVTTGKLKNGAVTSSKLAGGAVTSSKLAGGAVTGSKLGTGAVGTTNLADGSVSTSKLADNAVTSDKVQDGSLTASDVAPNTFLAADGVAADSTKLGGVPASGYLRGSGNEVSKRLTVTSGNSAELLELSFGHIEASCASSIPTLTFVADLAVDNVTAWSTLGPSTAAIQVQNSLASGGSVPVTGAGGDPESVTFQAAYDQAGNEKIATAWTTQQNILGTCVFTGQALTDL
jgi:hypothetical protein